jgi:hypothetical protein
MQDVHLVRETYKISYARFFERIASAASALGQKRTFRSVRAMSALPPKQTSVEPDVHRKARRDPPRLIEREYLERSNVSSAQCMIRCRQLPFPQPMQTHRAAVAAV